MTSTDTHTSGPWLQSSTMLVCNAEARIIANCTPMVDIPELAIPLKEVDANARLIAAAPDMLNILIAAYALLGGSYNSQQFEDQCGYMAEQISDVIIKATGKA